MSDRLLNAREIANYLGVSAETVLRWARRRQLPAFRLPGGAIRFREADLDSWLRERATTARGSSHPTPLAAARRVGYLASPNPHHEED